MNKEEKEKMYLDDVAFANDILVKANNIYHQVDELLKMCNDRSVEQMTKIIKGR